MKTDYGFICCSGFATVIDNGRCTVGGMCVPNSDGTAIPTTNTVGFKVLDRVDSTHILIFTEPSMGTINNINTINTNISNHLADQSNPHSVTAEQVGLGNVNNTSDMDKPISTAVQTALDKKASLVDGKIPKEQLPDDSFDNIVVETIADRDALSPFAGLLVHVKDASGDSSVSSAYADYIYDGETWAITGGATGSGGTADSVSWANITGKPSSYIPSAHASTHATGGSDPIIPADIGAVSQTDFDTLVETVNNLATLTDATTGAQYTLGVNAGKLVLVPYGEEVEPIANGDQTAY